MENPVNGMPVSPDELLSRIQSLEQRVSSLEEELVSTRSESLNHRPAAASTEYDIGIDFSGSNLESRFGESGLAWLGNIVLLFGIIFLVIFFQNKGFSIASAIIGYAAVTGLFVVSRYLKNSHPELTTIFNLNGYILLFTITLLLHYFTQAPLITSVYPSLILLLAVTVVQGYFAVRKQSEGLALLAFLMAAVTAIVSDQTHFLLPVTVAVSVAAVWFMHRFGWWRLLIFSIFLVYIVNFIWLVGDPFMGHPVQVLKVPHNGYIYLFLLAASYSSLALLKQRGLFSDSNAITSIIINGAGFSFMISLYVLAFYKDNYTYLFGSIAFFCLVYSIILQSRSAWKVTASLYALYSFVALSVTAYGVYGFPRVYFILSLQSLLVVIMALWFRSRVIIVMNTILFLILLITYLVTAGSINITNISFALVSLVTARVINWQKERLNIKTDLVRNTYLVTAFFMVLYALYKVMPGNYVTLSWTVAAALFFLLSLMLKNIKYRYLALATMVATALYLFIVDLARVEILYRVIAFLFLALISIALSLYYNRRRKKKFESEETT